MEASQRQYLSQCDCAGGTVSQAVNRFRLSSLSCHTHDISTVCLLSTGPHHIGSERQRMGEEVIENRAQRQAIQVLSDVKMLDIHDDSPAVRRVCLKCKMWYSIVTQHGWWMPNIAVMLGVRSEGELTPAAITWVPSLTVVPSYTCTWEP